MASLNNAPTGQIFSDRFKGISVSPFKGPKYFAINDATRKALPRVDDGSSTPDAS